MKTKDFDFHLPAGLIAKQPAPLRDSSRLLVLHRDGHRDGKIRHKRFSDLPEYLHAGDMLILNNTKVFPARLTCRKPGGDRLDILLVKRISGNRWEILSKGRYTGRLMVSEGLSLDVFEGKTAEIISSGDIGQRLWECGNMPLPPYIKREPNASDKTRYQTVYAEAEGSIAAPTAGLHFTNELLKRIKEKGVVIRYLTLHVGRGTFTPIKSGDVEGHKMEPEGFEFKGSLIGEIEKTKADGGRVFAVGTTVTRCIEGFASGRCILEATKNGAIEGTTDIFIYPGYCFRVVDSLITNFHLPRSTPLMLASAFAGFENIKAAYEIAAGAGYRFFSYGDAMLMI
jgi:S-adenosylmethionine:tRNA ribosyltransferase-isomerase